VIRYIVEKEVWANSIEEAIKKADDTEAKVVGVSSDPTQRRINVHPAGLLPSSSRTINRD
jgi:hypothetical protein